MLQVPVSFPAVYHSDALLKLLSDEGERSVYLAAIQGNSGPWVVKMLPPPAGGTPEALSAELASLGRMSSPSLPKVLSRPWGGSDPALVMEYVPGLSLAAILEEAEARSLLLPPAFGVVLAHDVFAAIQYFYTFDIAGRVHGNITPRTLMVGFTGQVKLVGFRPGQHGRAESGPHTASDVTAVAELLGELQFERFPREMVQLLPRLLEEQLSPLEAMAAAQAFVRANPPSPEVRGKVAAWLEEVFPAAREQQARETERLLSEGIKLMAEYSPTDRKQTPPPPAVDAPAERRRRGLLPIGVLVLALLVGGWYFLRSNLLGLSETDEPPVGSLMSDSLPSSASGRPEEPAALLALDASQEAGTLDAEATDMGAPDVVASDQMEASPVRKPRSAKLRSTGATSVRLLRSADSAFDAGNRIQAVRLATQALEAGGGARAHLALARYFRSMLRYREAIEHYRSALDMDPGNKIAARGVEVLEAQMGKR